ncbi:MAG TPA: methyl-accepting chemotaxis protein [Asticcacaulis sp.]|nr:methyl-accepting chemotaxis protein [Asticcacaulis sp.]
MLSRFAQSIQGKIALAFGFLMLVSLATGAFSIAKLNEVSKISVRLSDETAAVSVLGDLARTSQTLSVGSLLEHFAQDETIRQTYAQQGAEARAAFAKSWSQYSDMVSGATETSKAANLRKAWQHFLAVQEEVADLDKAGLHDEAAGVLMNDLQQEGARFYAAVRDVQTYRQGQAEAAKAQARRVNASARFWILAAMGSLTAVCVLTGWLLSVGISRPLGRLTAAMLKLAAQDMTAAIPDTQRKDEIGGMARSLQVFREKMIEAETLRAGQAEAETQMQARRRDEIARVADDFETTVGGIVTLVSAAASQLQGSAQALSAAAEETSAQSAAVENGARQAADNVRSVAAAIEELAASARQVGSDVARSSQISNAAVQQAGRTRASMDALGEDAQSVESVVGVISDIASQTNLLALNATIEAARAGDAGKGFAVVASEVKGLADQTAKSTTTINVSIAKMQASTQQAAGEISGIEQTISEVDAIAAAIAGAVTQQEATTSEIARNIHEVSLNTSEVTSNINGVTNAARASSQGAMQVLSAASDLAQQSEALKGEVERFLSRVRAA